MVIFPFPTYRTRLCTTILKCHIFTIPYMCAFSYSHIVCAITYANHSVSPLNAFKSKVTPCLTTLISTGISPLASTSQAYSPILWPVLVHTLINQQTSIYRQSTLEIYSLSKTPHMLDSSIYRSQQVSIHPYPQPCILVNIHLMNPGVQ